MTALGSRIHRQGIGPRWRRPLLIVATLTADPSKGAGLDAAVKTLGHAPFGRVLLDHRRGGLAAHGAYRFALARFARM